MKSVHVTTENVRNIDDYELMDKDFKTWWRKGLESFGMDTSLADQWEEETEQRG
ncbi:hypothetical protein [Paenibacillus sinensis]|uniref:hypothetical protein n=1 Tax=Paenibacillus sinensis TaxID=2834413 RepID=UPI001CAA0A93|nr:hypothetical protein [Paenibacillus sinensis]